MNYNREIHHRNSIRLKKYDYSHNGIYYLTLCTYNRKCLFGNIINNEMVLNNFGIIAYNEWIKSSTIRKEIELDEFVIMPNHIHGIIIIDNDDSRNISLENPSSHLGNQPVALAGPHSKSLGSLIAGYKSIVTKKINAIRNMSFTPVWQRNYYEHIIRHEKSLESIREYIINNPQTWQEDELYS